MTYIQRLLLAVLGLAVLTLSAQAAVDATDILIKALIKKQVITKDEAAAVRAEIAKIRQEEEAARKYDFVTARRPVRLSGYSQLRYTYSDDAVQSPGFEVKRIRLTYGGDATPVIDYKVQVEFAGSKKAVTTVDADPKKSKTELFGRPILFDAVIGYKLTQDARLSAGQFYVPFGLESTTSDASLDTINRSQATEKLVPGRDTGNQGRDIGLQFNGKRPIGSTGAHSLEYAVAVLNGSGINTGDDNRREDLVARLIVKPGIAGLTLGGAYYTGTLGSGETRHQRAGLEFVYTRSPWALKSEYFTGRDDVKKTGYYTTLVRDLTATTQGVLRYDHVSESIFKATDTVKPTTVVTAGLNWFLSKDTLTRFVVNYEHKRETGTQVSNDQLLAQLQASF